ncbi:MAG TPA: ABC transporter permease [Bacteroidia bacterium]|nr:ABC transporter permease [Bacteroidia bacterium]
MTTDSDKNSKEIPLPVRVYSSDNAKYNIVATLRSLVKEFPAAHALGLRFASRNISTRYRQSIFGLLWAFLPPLVTATIWIFLNKNNVIKLGDVGAPYPLFVITGTMLWSVFTNAVLMPMQIVQSNKSILVKINFPREALIINAFYEIAFNALVSCVIIAVFMVVLKVDISARFLLFFPGILLTMLLGMSLGLLILPFSLLYKDIQFGLPSVLQFAMYLTPIVYAKQPFAGLGKILKINPVTPVLTETRACLLNMNVYVPHWEIGLVASIAVVLFVIGIFLQRITMQTLIERMGS